MTDTLKKKKPWQAKSDKSERLQTKTEKSQLRTEKPHSKIEKTQVEYYFNM
jgi:hypothetical protein